MSLLTEVSTLYTKSAPKKKKLKWNQMLQYLFKVYNEIFTISPMRIHKLSSM